ncbi:MAG: hypothetical protein MUD01_13830 [Chloroflexaceae bacterium]|jgi:MFS family permease|nr:hypothetical protein [Chloroflexaceae bacterium]
MRLLSYIKTGNWPALFGYGLFTGMMAAGYYYNLTLVQLGLPDLGTRLIGMSGQAVAWYMALLAILTCGIALLTGLLMQRRGWSQRLLVKLRLAWAVVLLQTLLTVVVPFLRSEGLLLAWIIVASFALGVGVPATFSLTVDCIPTSDRGYVAAGITALAYAAAAIFAYPWRIERFSIQMLALMVPAVMGLGLLAFVPLPLTAALARQHRLPAFAQGRFVQVSAIGHERMRRSLAGLIVLMFGIYFIDSLGFLRLIATPLFVEGAWQSPEFGVRAFIGGTHAVAALVAGILYTALNERQLFGWIFGVFAVAELLYLLDLRLATILPAGDAPLVMPMLYATAVSLYTVVNFALWADISTPRTISRNTAIGVALSGWTATFLSTALALQWQAAGVAVDRHLAVVAALALLGFTAVLGMAMLRTQQRPEQPLAKAQSSQGGTNNNHS